MQDQLQTPTARKPDQRLTVVKIALSRDDLANLAEVYTACEEATGVNVTTSVLLGIALRAVAEGIRIGRFRWNTASLVMKAQR